MKQKLKTEILSLHKKYGAIKIKCEAKDSLPIDLILDFQAGLKKRPEKKLLHLIELIFSKGFCAPFFVWDNKGDFMCMDGHGREEAIFLIREAGVTIPGAFPVAYIHADDEADAREKLLSITSQFGEFDNEELQEWIDGIDADIAELLHFTENDIKLDIPGSEDITEGDDEISDDVPAITNLGDIWELGNHRLLCGDSTDPGAVDLLMDGKKADMVFTDPPYGVSVNQGSKEDLKARNRRTDGKVVQNDELTGKNLYEFLKSVFLNISESIKSGGSLYICHAESLGMDVIFRSAFAEAGFKPAEIIIWVKDAFAFGRQDYHWRHEPIIYGWKKGSAHSFFGGRKQDTVWEIPRPKKSEEYPTMKPIALCERAINNSSKEEDIIIDLFLGSGSTLIAAEKTNRICFGMELDEYYCDVIVKRYIDWMTKNNREINIKLNGKPFDYSDMLPHE